MTERRWQIPERRKPLTRKEYRELFMRQDGRCPNCGQPLEIKGGQEVEIIGRDEHINPLWRGGSNKLSNRELWCNPCTKPKTGQETTERGKSDRVRDKHIGAPKARSRPIPGSKASRWKNTFSGWEKRT